MRLKNLRWTLGILLLLFSVIVLAWSIWPARRIQRVFELPGANFELSKMAAPLLTSKYQVRVSWPEKVHVGRINRIWLQMDPISQSNLETTPKIDPEEYQVTEVRLEMSGVQLAPIGDIREALIPGKSIGVSWQVRTSQDGTYLGVIWLHLDRSPAGVSGTGERVLLFSQPIQIVSARLLGMDAYLAQVVGLIGIVLGTALCIDLVIDRLARISKSIYSRWLFRGE